jgi:hypothetical protein
MEADVCDESKGGGQFAAGRAEEAAHSSDKECGALSADGAAAQQAGRRRRRPNGREHSCPRGTSRRRRRESSADSRSDIAGEHEHEQEQKQEQQRQPSPLEQMRRRKLNRDQRDDEHDGQRANDNQMLWAEEAESIRLFVSKTTRSGADCPASAPRRPPPRRTRLIAQQRAARRLEFIRSSGGSPLGPRPPSLFALCLVVMQIITILPSCLIIYHGEDRAPAGAGGGFVSAVRPVSAAAAGAYDGAASPPGVGQKTHVKVGKWTM